MHTFCGAAIAVLVYEFAGSQKTENLGNIVKYDDKNNGTV